MTPAHPTHTGRAAASDMVNRRRHECVENLRRTPHDGALSPRTGRDRRRIRGSAPRRCRAKLLAQSALKMRAERGPDARAPTVAQRRRERRVSTCGLSAQTQPTTASRDSSRPFAGVPWGAAPPRGSTAGGARRLLRSAGARAGLRRFRPHGRGRASGRGRRIVTGCSHRRSQPYPRPCGKPGPGLPAAAPGRRCAVASVRSPAAPTGVNRAGRRGRCPRAAARAASARRR
jgi:hypothetical protein